MSFGFGPSDLINVSLLAWRVYKCCRDSSEEFQRIAKEVKILHITLKETEELLEEYHWDLTPSRRERLKMLWESCAENLNELDALIEKYDKLATPSQRVWDQMRWGLQDVSDIRQNIITAYTKLDAFNHVLSK
jgi:DNA repair exonuclease SbcCD ATPase subunit